MPVVQLLESLASVKYNQKMECFLLGKKRVAIEPNVIAPQKYGDFFDNKPMVLPEPQGVEGSGISCMPFKSRTMMPVSSSSFSSGGAHSRALSAPSQLCRSGYDRIPLPSVGSCNAVPSQIWPISDTGNERFHSSFVEAGRAIGSNNRGYRKASSFSQSITSKSRPTSLSLRKHEAHPLPLPVPQKNLQDRYAGEACDLGSVNSTVSNYAGVQAALGSLNLTYTSDAHRLPLPSEVLQKKAPLRRFTYEELSAGCRNFSPSYFLRETSVGPVYRSLVKNTQGNGEKMIVAIICLKRLHLKDEDEWISSITELAKMDNPYLCRLWGFCNLASFDQRKDYYYKMLVFEHMENESLDRLLLRKEHEPPLGWFARLKIALGTAKGLAYLYGKYPFQVFYEDFNMSNVQIDEDCTPKLSDYGLRQVCGVGISLPAFAQDSRGDTILGSSPAERDIVRSFGKFLLGLLSAQKHLEKLLKGEGYSERLVKLMLNDTTQTESILDPVLQGHHITRSVRKVLHLALQCLQEDAVLRPQIEDVVKMLSSIQQLRNYDVTSNENSSKRNLANSDGDKNSTVNFKWRNAELCTQPMYELPQLVEDTSSQEYKSPLLPEPHSKAGWQPPPGNSNSKGLIRMIITWALPNLGSKPPASPKTITTFSCANSFLKQKMGNGARKHKILQSS